MSTKQKLENKAYVPKAWEEVACPICNSTDKHLYERFGNDWQYSYVLCHSCKLVYLSPRPMYDDEFVSDAYEYYADEDPRYELSDSYYKSVEKDYEHEISEIKQCDHKRTLLLDVGCAIGGFLYVARHHYQKVYGLEVSQRMAQQVRQKLGVDVFTQRFEDLNTSEKFSCIYMSHVIEHIPHPNLWLQKAKTLLDKEGILVIMVPNMFSLTRRLKVLLKNVGIRKGRWEPWRTPDHLYEPTIPAMLTLFENNNYEVLHYYTYSRKDMIAQKSTWSKLFHRKFYHGSNLRFYVRPKVQN
jgi:SAM-dependent methyltransferase